MLFCCASAHRRTRVSAPEYLAFTRWATPTARYTLSGKTHSVFPSSPIIASKRPTCRHNFNRHSRTFSITHRVRRKRQRLPSSLVIENPRRSTPRFYFNMARLGFPMNANDYTEVGTDGLLNAAAFCGRSPRPHSARIWTRFSRRLPRNSAANTASATTRTIR